MFEKHVVASSCLSADLHELGFDWMYFVAFDVGDFYENLLRKFKVH
jgi:hypothetical protein